jgi:cytochrome P450
MTETRSAEAVERELGGCPVMHRDFSGSQAAGCHWQLAEELREASPLYFNTFAQGYWVFTRYDAVRDMYKSPAIFSSESITPWQPDPIYRFVPTQIDPPDHIQYRRILNPWFSPRAIDDAEARMRDLCGRLVDEVAPTGGCDFVSEFALRFPTEAFLSVIGIDPADADLFVPWVEDFFSGFGGDPAGLERMTEALAGIRE